VSLVIGSVGQDVGAVVGTGVGASVGGGVGAAVGASVGEEVGVSVGAAVGTAEGGATVHPVSVLYILPKLQLQQVPSSNSARLAYGVGTPQKASSSRSAQIVSDPALRQHLSCAKTSGWNSKKHRPGRNHCTIFTVESTGCKVMYWGDRDTSDM
jgi:hypothetical protein